MKHLWISNSSQFYWGGSVCSWHRLCLGSSQESVFSYQLAGWEKYRIHWHVRGGKNPRAGWLCLKIIFLLNKINFRRTDQKPNSTRLTMHCKSNLMVFYYGCTKPIKDWHSAENWNLGGERGRCAHWYLYNCDCEHGQRLDRWIWEKHH